MDREQSHRVAGAAQPGDHFLKLMFFQGSGRGADEHEPYRGRASGEYRPLHHARAGPARFALPQANSPAPVRMESPAVEVMTDLRQIEAVTIGRLDTLAAARQVMIHRGVRALFVIDEDRIVHGIITATDLQSEAPVRLANASGLRYDEVLVRDVMTPADRLEVLHLDEVLRSRVGDVVATLRAAGRQHALAVEAPATGPVCVRGIFSLTQIARQLGVPVQPVNDIARTFAEIEAAIAS